MPRITVSETSIKYREIVELDQGHALFSIYDLPTEGAEYMVWTSEYIGPARRGLPTGTKKLRWSDDAELLAHGLAGNSDHTVKRFHGWRGTMDDWYCEARGVRECVSVREIEYQKTAHQLIEFGPDLVPDEA